MHLKSLRQGKRYRWREDFVEGSRCMGIEIILDDSNLGSRRIMLRQLLEKVSHKQKALVYSSSLWVRLW